MTRIADGERRPDALVGLLLDLGQRLRRAGIAASLGEMVDAAEALRVVDLGNRPLVREVLAACLVKRAEHRERFDRCFDAAFPLSRPGPAAPPPGAPSPAGQPRQPDRSAASFHADLREALVEGDEQRLGLLAGELIERFAGLGEGRGTEKYHLYRVLRAVDLAKLLAEAMREARERGEELSALDLKLVRAELSERLEALRRQLAREIRARLDSGRPGEEAGPGEEPGPVDLGEVDFLGATAVERMAMREAVRPLARKLAAQVAQRRRLRRQGRLDVRRTLRRSLGAGGVPLDPAFRRRRPHRPELVVLCDVSGSVAEFAQFTLALLNALHAEFAKLRSFAFVDGIAEVTDELTATHEVYARWLVRKPGVVAGDGHTDLATAFGLFLDRYAGSVLNPGTTVLITGDARTNYRPDGADALAHIARMARRVYWLNPEPRSEWATSDSAVDAYRAHCTDVVEVRNLTQLSEFVLRIT